MLTRASKIMIIRHAEKPAGHVAGVDESGACSGHHLSVRGWQRAGALACLFAPARGALQSPLLARPEFIFASAAVDDPEPGNSRSRRPEETVGPLAEVVGVAVDLRFSKGEEKALAAAAMACGGPVLIAWQHENISAIAHAITGVKIAPHNWPSERFDLVFVFTLNRADGTYGFAQVPQRLLAGDSREVIWS
jgi:hypothetical protein